MVDPIPQPPEIPQLTAMQRLQEFLDKYQIIVDTEPIQARAVAGGGMLIDVPRIRAYYRNSPLTTKQAV